jgi:hypothetical protein
MIFRRTGSIYISDLTDKFVLPVRSRSIWAGIFPAPWGALLQGERK